MGTGRHMETLEYTKNKRGGGTKWDKTEDKKQRKQGMKIREDWRTPIYFTTFLCF